MREVRATTPCLVRALCVWGFNMSDSFDFDYLQEIDTLEIFFDHGATTCAVEIADHITLRFRQGEGKALSLIVENVSYLTKPAEVGPRSFALKLDRLPAELRQEVIHIITRSPVNQFLKVSTYSPAPTRRPVPVAYVERVAALAA